MVAEVSTNEIAGRVARVNERGILLRDHDTWANLSKWATGITMPEVGQLVRLTLDRAGFVREVTVDGEPAPAVAVPTGCQPVDRDTRIMRQAVLNTAVALLSTHQCPLSVAAVLHVAGELEQWVTR